MFRRSRSLRIKRRPRRRPDAAEAQERRRRNRVVLKALLGAGLAVDAVLVVILIYAVSLHVPSFTLQHVDVNGNRRLSTEEVVEAAEIESGMSLLTVNLTAIAERLKRHPWIHSASVYRRFPGRIILEIQERTPRAILAAEKLYYLDAQGECFTRLLPGDSTNYPLFTGIAPEDLNSKGPRVRETVRKGLGLLDVLDRSRYGLSCASVEEIRVDLDGGLSLKLCSGRELVVGFDDFENKIQRYGKLRRLLTRLGQWNKARIIDLDFEDRALVRWRKAPPGVG